MSGEFIRTMSLRVCNTVSHAG